MESQFQSTVKLASETEQDCERRVVCLHFVYIVYLPKLRV